MHRAGLEGEIDAVAAEGPGQLRSIGVEAELRLADRKHVSVDERGALGLADEALDDVEADGASIVRLAETEGPVPLRVSRQEAVRVIPSADGAREIDGASVDA